MNRRMFSPSQMKGLLEVCDPSGTGLISISYLTTLAEEHCKSKEKAQGLVQMLDPGGRGSLTYKEFCMGVKILTKKTGGRDMMGPSLEQRCSTDKSKTSHYINTSDDDVTTSSNDSDEKLNGRIPDGESYESYGEVEMSSIPPTIESDEGIEWSTPNNLRRNTWYRTSLRKTSNNSEVLPNRRWGSFRHASGKRLTNNLGGSQLHRSSSFNSSGRNSTCDTGEDVYSDISLEEDVLDLNHKVQMLQQQMNVLADNQNHSDERYTRAKQENATLQARVHMLEEQLREAEVRAEERLAEEERRHRELVCRVDREKQLQVENCAIRLQTLELENSSLKEEANRCRVQADKLRAEKEKLEEQVRESEGNVTVLKEEIASLRDQERKYREKFATNQQLIEELTLEVERLRNEQRQALEELSIRRVGIPAATHEELQAQFSAIKEENRRLKEAHDEMQALLLTRSVEQGRSLLTENNSLAVELQDMSQDELEDVPKEELAKVNTALKEQQEVNSQLMSYINGILLNIVENHPQLLEVKPKPQL